MKKRGIKIGDLVHMHRRIVPGLGLVLNRQDDLKKYAGFDCDLFVMRSRIEEEEPSDDSYISLNFWGDIEKCSKKSTYPDAARAYVEHNHYGAIKKERIKFVQVKWFHKPSDYTNSEVFHAVGWYPLSFLRSL
tara:strand:+ start:2736 stop:3134 length:399 start_codon:yes stop_codon:yes gene_type:complete